MNQNAQIIVFGNEKGGSGKSTTAMHVAIALVQLGYKVGTIDLDAHQGTFTRYFRNRWTYITRHAVDMPSPDHLAIELSQAETVAEQQKEEREFFALALAEFMESKDFIIVDTPGRDCYLSRLAHSHAHILITPVNDSYIDLDLIVNLDQDSREILGPSVYTKMVHEQRRQKKLRDGGAIDWIVMRNRLSHINAKNKQDIADILDETALLYGFRVAPGFGERVIFRELFLKGMTLLDLQRDPEFKMTVSHLSARQEVRNLIRAIAPERSRGLRAEYAQHPDFIPEAEAI